MTFALTLDVSDDAVIKALYRKERWAQQKVYEEYYGKLMAIGMRYAKDPEKARDLMHDGFIKAFDKIHGFKLGTSFSAWIGRLMVNVCIDHLRKQKIRRTDDIDTAYDISNDEVSAVDICSENELLGYIQELSPVYKAVFNMYVIDGYSHKEIANKLDISESSSRSNLVKARSNLKKILKAKLHTYDR